MAEAQGTVSAKNDIGFKLQGIEGPSKGWFNFSKPEYRDAQFDEINVGDYISFTTSGEKNYVKSITKAPPGFQPNNGGFTPPASTWQQPAAQPPQAPPDYVPDPPVPWENTPLAPPTLSRDEAIIQQTCLKAATKLWLGILPANKGATLEQAVADVIAMAQGLRAAIRG